MSRQMRMFNVSTPAERGLVNLASPAVLFAVVFIYLGLAPVTAVLAAAVWVAQGATGAVLIRWLMGGVSQRHAVWVVLGPGALLGIGISISLFLLVRGGLLGVIVVTCALFGGALAWGRQTMSGTSATPQLRAMNLVALIGCALVANSKEFPNLLVVGVTVITLGISWEQNLSLRRWIPITLAGSVALGLFAAARAEYWWWSSDDTTMLSAIGTMIIERGQIADVAGWRTDSFHWLLHAWLALWNHLSFGFVFETYLIAWPVVAASATIASLWLCGELFLRRSLNTASLMMVALVTAGLIQLEWPAPQEQQPFLFAMVAVSALWLSRRTTERRVSTAKTIGTATLLLVIVPIWLYLMKPSLLVAHGLLILGALLARFDWLRGRRLVGASIASLTAIFVGIGFLALASAWISRRSFTSFGIEFFPDDLGWCKDASLIGSLVCVVSLQAVLLFAAALGATVMLLIRPNTNKSDATTRATPLLMVPLILAYLPLRYFVGSGVGSGATSFYRLPEMALMLVVAISVAWLLESLAVQARELTALVLIATAAALVSRSPGRIYDQVESWLVSMRPLRYLNASDVIALVFVCIAGLVVARLAFFGKWPWRFLTVVMIVVSFTPITRMAVASATTVTPAGRLARPADLGPSDIEDVGRWLQSNTSRDALIATNYLCPTNRLDECTRSNPLFECPKTRPVLMAGWVLSALSKRDFLYLSQGWNTKTGFCFDHERSTRLGSEVSKDAIDELRDRGVGYYIASLDHTDSRAWQQLVSISAFTTENFAVVSLDKLLKHLST